MVVALTNITNENTLPEPNISESLYILLWVVYILLSKFVFIKSWYCTNMYTHAQILHLKQKQTYYECDPI